MESPGTVAMPRRRPLPAALLPLLVNSVLGTVQAHVVCVVSNKTVVHEMTPADPDGAKVAVDGSRRPQMGVTFLTGHHLLRITDAAGHEKDTWSLPFEHVAVSTPLDAHV